MNKANVKVSLTPRGDTIFKAIFGDQRNVHILKAFLRAVFNESAVKVEFSELEIANTDLIADNKDERNSAVDVLAITENGEKIDIEIQINDHHDIQNRTVFYASRMITSQVTKKVKLQERYKNIKAAIVIAILDFKIRPDDNKYFHGNILKDMFDNKIYTETQQIYILELPKIPKNDDNKELWTWLKFLSSNSVAEMQKLKNKIKEVDEAVSIYKNFISDEELKNILETREIKYKLDRNEWFAEGEINAKVEAVIAFVKTGMSLKQVCQTLNVDENIKQQAINKLNKMGIKYND